MQFTLAWIFGGKILKKQKKNEEIENRRGIKKGEESLIKSNKKKKIERKKEKENRRSYLVDGKLICRQRSVGDLCGSAGFWARL